MLFSSFNHLSIVRMKQLLPECPVGALVEHDDLFNAGYYCKKYGFEFYHPDSDLLTAENVKTCKDHGIGINTWTVNDLASLERACDWELEGVFTNYPHFVSAWAHRGR